MSNSVRPRRRQPTRFPHPWDSPVKSTGVGCHFLLQCMKVKSESEVTQSCPTLSDPMDCSPPGSSIHGIFQARVLEWGKYLLCGTYQKKFLVLKWDRIEIISLCLIFPMCEARELACTNPLFIKAALFFLPRLPPISCLIRMNTMQVPQPVISSLF